MGTWLRGRRRNEVRENRGENASGRWYVNKRKWVRFRRAIGGIFKKDGFWWIAFVLSTLAVCCYLTLTYWPYLHDGKDSLSSTVRNVSLVIGGIIAIELALWRGIVGLRQVKTAQRGLLNERFQKGAEMLGSEALSVRLGGIYALHHLAEEHPDVYHIQVMKLLCAFVRYPTEDEVAVMDLYEEEQGLRADIVAVVEIICKRSSSQIQIERSACFSLDLKNADLSRLSFRNGDLSGADFFGARLTNTSFEKANLSNAQFADATFSDFQLRTGEHSVMDKVYKAISHAKLLEANVSGTTFSLQKGYLPVKGLLQRKFNEAWAAPRNEPALWGVRDAETRESIVWQRKSCNGRSSS